MRRSIICLFLLIALGACSTPSAAVPVGIAPLASPQPLATRTIDTVETAAPLPTPSSVPPTVELPTLHPTATAGELKYRIVGYYPAWSNPTRDGNASDLPGDQLTHVIYAFSSIDPKSHTCTYGAESVDKYHFKHLRELKQKYPHLKILIAIGGATGAREFSDVSAKADLREKFVKSCLDLYLGTHGDVFDGIDIDWEFPGVGDGSRTADPQNLTLLLKEFRRQLAALGKQKHRSYLLTAAVPAGLWLLNNYELQELAPVLDWFNVMTYDYSGAWSKETNFTAPLYHAKDDPYPANNVEATVQAYLAAGVLPHKITLGIPFYGRGWTAAAQDNNGLYQKLARGKISGTAFTYRNLVDNYIGKNGYYRYWDYGAKVPWLFNPTDRVFITYEDPESINYKADYVIDHYLGGAMIWHLSSDADDRLLQTLHDRLAQSTP